MLQKNIIYTCMHHIRTYKKMFKFSQKKIIKINLNVYSLI